jgi:eukaryotic-like serine/threonine-protein kinase
MAASGRDLPDRLGRYEILGRLATGGMAEIFLARLHGPVGFERAVVVKRILPHLAGTDSFVGMFVDEAKIIARIRHPNVVQVQELAREDGELFLVMEYLEGESVAGLLKRAIARSRPLDRALAAFVVAEACSGLHAAHEIRNPDGTAQEIVHRDVSPQNVLVGYDGRVKVLDFGIAKAADRITRTEAGQLKGKFEYMAPEQCRGEPLDRRCDLFALGILLYELTSGRRLFKRTTQLETLRAICDQPFVPPSRIDAAYPSQLEPVLRRALARNREDRYPTALAMRKDIVAAMRGLGTFEEDAREALSELMTSLFEDRIADKAEMLRRVRDGSSVPFVAAGEVDESIEIPVIADDGTAAGSYLETTPLAGKRSKTRTPSFWVATGMTAIAAGCAAFAWGLGSWRQPALVTAPPAAAVTTSAAPGVDLPAPAASVVPPVASGNVAHARATSSPSGHVRPPATASAAPSATASARDFHRFD